MGRSLFLITTLMLVATHGLSNGVDPTRPLNINTLNSPVVGNDAVTFILVSEKRTFAVVHGQTVKVGDRVGTKEVMAIYPDRVELEDSSTGEVEVNFLTKTKVLN